MLSSLASRKSWYKLFEEDYSLTPWEGGLTIEKQKRRVAANSTDTTVTTSTQLDTRISFYFIYSLFNVGTKQNSTKD